VSFLDAIHRARELLQREGRISLRALKLELELDDEQLEALTEELVEIQGVAVRDGRALVWNASGTGAEEETLPPPPVGQELTAERRQLTVLFCDLVDSTRLAAGMDAEDWRALVQRYHAAAGEGIARFDGHVAQYLGDGILAYFGWPRAHEDDAERAVRAGLGIVEAVGSELSVRISIHTGPVVVGEIGAGASRETLALGDTTNLAARLQAIAEPDTVVISSATLRLVSGVFVTQDLGAHAVKGIADPVRAHRALSVSGVRSRLDVTAATELTPFIGRDQELMLLEDRFAQVGEGNGQAVLIQGEAGIGKSRLVQAFRERIAERAHSWLECRGSAYTQDSAFHPVLELHRQGLGFRTDDPAETKLDRIAAGLEAVGFDAAETVPVVAALHGIPLGTRFAAPNLSPEGMRKRTFEVLTEWLLRLGRRQPLVLLMEDLHWMDPSMIELVGRILEQIPTAPVLLLATYRPDFSPPWGARSFLTPMLLSRFTRAQLADLVRKAARGRDLPESWVTEILRRADGVPLFAEELTRTLLDQATELPEDGALPLHIPETLQDSLMARLDALGPVKELAQVGSVLGREFTYDVLLAVSPIKDTELQEALRSAVREELFYQRGAPPDATYLFKHALIRDAAYQSMLRATRQRHHRRVAETLVTRLPHLAETQPELVAQHWSEAGDAETAIEWWRRSGQHAVGRAVYGEALAHIRRGLSLLDFARPSSRADAERELTILLGSALAAARGYAHPETMEAWERARALCADATHLRRRAQVLAYLCSAHTSGGRYGEALEVARELEQLGEDSDDAASLHHARYVIGSTLLFRGRLRDALDCLSRLAATLASAPNTSTLGPQHASAGISYLSFCLALAGFPERSRVIAQLAIERTRASGHRYSVVQAEVYAAVAAMLRRDWSETVSLAGVACDSASRQGIPLMAALATMAGATAQCLGKGDAKAIETFQEALRQGASTGNRACSTVILTGLAAPLLEAGRLEEASRAADAGIAIAASIGEGIYLAELHRLKGGIALRHGRADEAAAHFQQAFEIARSQEAKLLELRAATSLARLWRDQGKRTEARDLLAPIYAWFTEGFDTLDLVEAKALLEELGA
jgi:class 3 adenylate cyclase/tetratricopeptide (TPR) repeat protein